MVTIKAYTDLEQSKKLAEILPIESADMVLLHEEPYETSDSKFDGLHQALCVPFDKYDKSWRQKYKNISYFPCWSLASLLGVLPNFIGDYGKCLYYDIGGYYCGYMVDGNFMLAIEETKADNLIDACVEMIIKLHELNLL